jgi:hypothetical protein
MNPDEFRDRTAGPKKQMKWRTDFDQPVVEAVKSRFGLAKAAVIHPAVMYRLFSALWSRRATADLVQAFTSFRRPAPLEAADNAVSRLPRDYVAAKFYFSKAFPDTAGNRRFVAELLARVSRQAPVALLSTAVRLDEHSDFQTSGNSGLFVVDAHTVPEKNLEQQTRLICGARGFIGTYGGFSYLAPFYNVRSLSFFDKRFGFESHHLDLAERVFDRLLPGGFAAFDRRAIDLVEPAIDRWTRAESAAAAVTDPLEVEAKL